MTNGCFDILHPGHVDYLEKARALGDRLVINDDVPAMAANAKSIVYGDFKPYIIRDVMAFTLFRMTDSAYAKKGQVGFLMLSRHAGNFTDIGGGVKHYQNAAS